MKKVTKQERWDFVKDKNVTFTVDGNYPFTGVWKDRSGSVVAKDVPDENNGKYEHYIAADKRLEMYPLLACGFKKQTL